MSLKKKTPLAIAIIENVKRVEVRRAPLPQGGGGGYLSKLKYITPVSVQNPPPQDPSFYLVTEDNNFLTTEDNNNIII